MAKKKEEPALRVFIKARHDFNATEAVEAGRKLTRAMERKGEKEASLKSLSSKLKAEIKELDEEINEAANNVRNGGEERQVEATVEFVPKKGIKIFFYHCPENKELHGKEIKRDRMTEVDYEGQLPLGDEPAPPKPDNEKKGDEPGENTGQTPAPGTT